METRLWFQECSYNNKTTLSPLVISELSEEEELEFINALYDIYRENQVPGRRCKLLKDMERIFDETHNADVANALAILEANEHTIYDPPAVFDSNKSEILL